MRLETDGIEIALMTEYFADTNVFIAIFKGNYGLAAFLNETKPAINTIVYLELIQDANLKRKLEG